MELKMYSIAELTSILNLHPKTILRFIKEGKIKARKIGRAWMVSEEDLRIYCHGELSGSSSVSKDQKDPDKNDRQDQEAQVQRKANSPLKSIRVSSVVEIDEQESEEASRLSNSIMAMLNSERELSEGVRYDFFYSPETGRAKHVFYGPPEFMVRMMKSFEILSKTEE